MKQAMATLTGQRKFKDNELMVWLAVNDAIRVPLMRYAECRRTRSQPPVTPVDLADGQRTVKRMAAFADGMCACKDSGCASAAQKAVEQWLKIEFAGGSKQGTRAMVESWRRHYERHFECYKRLTANPAP